MHFRAESKISQSGRLCLARVRPIVLAVSVGLPGLASAQGGMQGLNLESMDLETTLLAVQTQRTQLLEIELRRQLQEIQAKNDKIAQLNQELASLTEQRAMMETRKTATSATQIAQLDNKINSVKQEIASLTNLTGVTGQTPEQIELRKRIEEFLAKIKGTQTKSDDLNAQLESEKKEQLAAQEAQKKEQQRKEQELKETKGPEPTKQPSPESPQTSPSISPSATKEPGQSTPGTKEELQKYEQQLALMKEKIKQLQNDPSQQKLLAQKQQELQEMQQKLLKMQQEMGMPPEQTAVQDPAQTKPSPSQTTEQTKRPETEPQKQVEQTPTKGDPGLKGTEKPVQTLTPDQQKQLVQLLQKLPAEKLLPLAVLAQYAQKGGTLPSGLSGEQLSMLRALGQLPPDTLAQLQTKLLSQLPPEKRAELTRAMETLVAKLQQQQELQKVVEEKTQQTKVVKDIEGSASSAAALSKLDELQQSGVFESTQPQTTLSPDMTREKLTELLTRELFGQPQTSPDPWTTMPDGTTELLMKPIKGIDPIQTSLLGTELERQDLAEQSAAAAAGAAPGYPYIEAGNALSFASWPTAMVATYNGRVSGTLNSGAAIGGAINMTADFARLQSSFTPGVPGSITFDNGKGGMTFNLVRSGNYVGNDASGTYNGQAVTGYIMNGQFYGPQAQELGGQWSMQNAGATLTANGNFATKR